ncbi:hypothetical protein [Peribacillus sp. NPDC097895]
MNETPAGIRVQGSGNQRWIQDSLNTKGVLSIFLKQSGVEI